MTKVILHGELGKAVGRSRWRLSVKTAAEALRLIEANTRKLYRYLAKQGAEIPFRIVVNGKDMQSIDEMHLPYLQEKTIHFLPVHAGESNGGLLVGIGLVLLIVAATLIFSPAGGALTASLGGGEGAAAAAAAHAAAITSLITGMSVSLGLSFTLAGISALLSKSPNTQNAAQDASYLFKGPVNTIQQGGPVPLCYGEMIVGSQTISAGVRSTDIGIPGT